MADLPHALPAGVLDALRIHREQRTAAVRRVIEQTTPEDDPEQARKALSVDLRAAVIRGEVDAGGLADVLAEYVARDRDGA
ncbi:hypothetical protein [Actinoplanes siamensis]|nr:hypothetical protein [Actinoplanes siamensis]